MFHAGLNDTILRGHHGFDAQSFHLLIVIFIKLVSFQVCRIPLSHRGGLELLQFILFALVMELVEEPAHLTFFGDLPNILDELLVLCLRLCIFRLIFDFI